MLICKYRIYLSFWIKAEELATTWIGDEHVSSGVGFENIFQTLWDELTSTADVFQGNTCLKYKRKILHRICNYWESYIKEF